MLSTEATAGMRVRSNHAQPLFTPKCPGRKGELLRPNIVDDQYWYVWLDATKRSPAHEDLFNVRDLSQL